MQNPENDTTFTVPFQIGDEYWMPVGVPQQVTIPCPVCNGDLAVTITLGTGEALGVHCECCQKGFNAPRGVVEEWELEPSAVRFVIASVASMHDGRWSVRSTTGGYTNFHELCTTEADALAKSVELCAAQHERNMQSRQHQKKGTANAAWSVQYHRNCIKDLERQIAWHQGRILKPVPSKGKTK